MSAPKADKKKSLEEHIKRVNASLTEKMEEMDKREKFLNEKAVALEQFMKNSHTGKRVMLRVGSGTYYTTADILGKIPNSYFTGLLSQEFKPDEDRSFFIARDGGVFRYVLEFLTYGNLYTPFPDEGTRQLCLLDAKFYMLPELVKLVEDATTTTTAAAALVSPKPVCAKYTSSLATTTEEFVVWDAEPLAGDSAYYMHAGEVVSVLKAGTYLISIRVAGSHSDGSSLSLSLQLNGSEIANCYQAETNGAFCTSEINEIFALPAAAALRVQALMDGYSHSDAKCCVFSLLYLGA